MKSLARNKNILITSAGRRVDLVKSFIATLKKKKLNIKVITADANPEYSSACQINKTSVKLPKVNEKNFVKKLNLICKKYSIGMIIPTIDNELFVYSKLKFAFKKKGIFIIVSDTAFIDYCQDKYKTKNLFNKYGINYPTIYSTKNIKFPCIVKPRIGSSSQGIQIFSSKSFMPIKIRNDSKVIIMKYLGKSYQEFTIDMYFNRNNDLCSFVPRKRIETKGGEISKGLTVKDNSFNKVLESLRKVEGAVGCINLQVFRSKNKFFGIEVNARFGGGYPLSFSAGANFPEFLIDEYFFNKTIKYNDKWKHNLLMLRYDEKFIKLNGK